jgi:hypothetical protein
MKRSSFSKYTLPMAVRLSKRWTGFSFRGSSNDVSGNSTPHDGINQPISGANNANDGTSFETHSDIVPIADNPDLYKVRFKKRGMTKLKRTIIKVRRLFRRMAHFIAQLRSDKFSQDEKIHMLITLHEWKPDDLEEHRRLKEEKKLFVFHKQQAKLLELQIIEILTNLGFCFHVTKEDRKYIKKRVKIAKVEVSPFAYVYHITSVPFGVKKTDMSQDWVATEIASSIGKKIRHELDLYGLRYTVEVGSTLSIPNFASFSDVEKMPKNMPPLAFYLGQTTNGAPVYRNLTDAPHMIVAGQTGGGKSNLLNGIICGYLMRQPASTVKFILFDLKGGVEFDAFYGIPHLWQHANDADGIIEYPEQIVPALESILKECNDRLGKLKKAKVKNIAEFNRGKHAKNKIPYLIGIFDEYTTARKLAGDKVETLLSTIANLSRAAGIHFIIGTQYPKSDVLSTLISVNFPWRIAFNMSTAASQSVLGNWDAFGLTPTGRALFQSSDGVIHIQTPRITESTIHSIVNDVKGGVGNITIKSVDPEEIIEYALNNTEGRLTHETIFNQFKERTTDYALRDLLKSMEGKEFDLNGVLYKIIPGYSNVPRRVELVDTRSTNDAPDTTHHTTTEEG